MNPTIRLAIGVGLGAGLGYFVADVIVEIIHLKEEQKLPYDDYEGTEEFPHDLEDENMEVQIDLRKRKSPIMSKKKNIVVTKDYTKHFDPKEKIRLEELAAKYNQGILPPDEVPAPDEIVEDQIDEDPGTGETDENIEIISLEEYAASDTGYVKTSLNYYAGDDVVTDEKDTPLSDPEGFLGEDALVSFGLQSDDDDVVYVRNHELRGEYEVVRLHRSYRPVGESTKRRTGSADQMKEEGYEEDNER